MALPKDQFFAQHRERGEMLTYGDVRIETWASQVTAQEVDTTTRFSKNVEQKNPFVAAAMDTVSEYEMGIAQATMGGLAIIHGNLSIKEQRDQVRKVKLHLNGLIEKPITVSGDETVGDVLEMCERREFGFRTFPVVDREGVVQGILTSNDFRYFKHRSDSLVSEAMTPREDMIFASRGVTPNEAFEQMVAARKSTLPIVNDRGALQGMYVWSDVERVVEGNPKSYNLDSQGRLKVGAAVPTNPEALERAKALEGYVDVIVIDTAQGDSRFALETLRLIKENISSIDVVVGNVSTAESARMLAENGADGVKAGQGPGSICTTRTQLGNGTTQLSAVYEAKRIMGRNGGRRGRELFSRKTLKLLEKLDVPICADGGIEEHGHLSIAIAAGADTVMMGSAYSGTDEAPGELFRDSSGNMGKYYRGMGSAEAIRERSGSRARYGIESVLASEGVKAFVPYKGSVRDVVALQLEYLRKSMSQSNSATIRDHQQNARFNRSTNAGQVESAPHGVQVVADN